MGRASGRAQGLIRRVTRKVDGSQAEIVAGLRSWIQSVDDLIEFDLQRTHRLCGLILWTSEEDGERSHYALGYIGATVADLRMDRIGSSVLDKLLELRQANRYLFAVESEKAVFTGG